MAFGNLLGVASVAAVVPLLPVLDIAPPAIFWPTAEIAIDAFHHAVYAMSTGTVYEMPGNGKGRPRG